MELRFDRRELAGSLGDLGTLLPISIGLILINGIDSTAVFITVGLYYVLSGLYFRTTVPVQPMKVIGAYAIAQALSPVQISTAGLWMGGLLLVLGALGAVDIVAKHTPRPVIRGVQLTTGVMLLTKGVGFVLGKSSLQAAQGTASSFLSIGSLGPVPVGMVLGLVSVVMILLLLENRVAPAALVVLMAGAAFGLAFDAPADLGSLDLGLHLPAALPFGLPSASDITIALVALALPQMPMTIGNAVIAQADLTKEYFGEEAAGRSTVRALTVSMGLANLATAIMGGMPLCHGAGGLAAHYRFGARTAASNLMIGGLFLVIGLFVGDQAPLVLSVVPFSVLGALLAFAGTELALRIQDLEERRDLFVAIAILGVSLSTSLAWGFVVGIALALALRSGRLTIG